MRDEVESGKTEVLHIKSLNSASKAEAQRSTAKLKILENELSQVSDRQRSVSFNKDKMEINLSMARKKILEAERSVDFERVLQSELDDSKSKLCFLKRRKIGKIVVRELPLISLKDYLLHCQCNVQALLTW